MNDQRMMASRVWNRHAWLLATIFITLVALLWRLHYVIEAHVIAPVRGDATDYVAYTKNLVNAGVFSKSTDAGVQPEADSFRDPGYPLFLALVLKLSSNPDAWYSSTLLIQACMSALTVMLTLFLFRGWLRPGWLLAAGLLMAVWPHTVTSAGILLTETQTGFLCACGLLLIRLGLERGQTAWMLLAGLVFGLAALTNAVLLLFPPVLIAWLFWQRQCTRSLLISFALAWLVLPAGWALRNSQLPSSQTSSYRAVMNLVQGSWPEYHDAFQTIVVKGDPSAQPIMDAISNELALVRSNPREGWHVIARRLSAHPWSTATWYLHKPLDLWGWSIAMGQGDIYVFPTADSPYNTDTAYRLSAAICYGLNPLIMALAALAVFSCVLRRREVYLPMAPAALLLLCLTAVYAIFQSEPRYSTPVRFVEIGFAALAAQNLLALAQARLRIRAAIGEADHKNETSFAESQL